MANVFIVFPLAITFSICCWTAIYYLVRHTFSSKTTEWCVRILTLLHGCLISVTGLPECFSKPEGIFEHSDNPSNNKQLMIMLISLGYFLLDLVWCLYHQSETTVMLVHHAFSCLGLCRILWKNTTGALTVCGMGALEATNPILQIRWFLRSEGFYNTIWFTSVELLFVLLFFLIRICLGTYSVYEVLFVYSYEWEYRIFVVIIYFVSIVFAKDIFKYLWRKYGNDKLTVHIEDVNVNVDT